MTVAKQSAAYLGPAAILIIGAPLRQDGMLFNTAVIIRNGAVIGIVPKSFIPNYGEFYEKRWFVPASSRYSDLFVIAGTGSQSGREVPFTPNLIVESAHGVRLACEICEDLWAACPPSSFHAMRGANLIVNLSASNEVATKADYRRDLVKMQSGRCMCAYLYASSGMGESTTDLIFSGHRIIADYGTLVREETEGNGMITALIDVERLENDRLKRNSQAYEQEMVKNLKYVIIPDNQEPAHIHPVRNVNPYPFVPAEGKRRFRCEEIIRLQEKGLYERLRKTGIGKSVIGISGGLDSTLALLVVARTYERLCWPLTDIIGITMPGFGTTDQTRNNAVALMELLGITSRNIDIKKSCLQHFTDIGHNPQEYDITYENAQARERTQILMDVANREGGLVIGTGDLSELALGWCTYNGDHMSMYAVNSSVPKTLVRYLVETYGEIKPELKDVLDSICGTVISPELLPPDNDGRISQSTEGSIGTYDLHDFFLYHYIRNGFKKEKIYVMACAAFADMNHSEIEQTLDLFYQRFYSQQFKRSCLPDGPKVGTVSLSPRGDWRMPSDISYPAD